jgi:tellurite resistance protein
MAPAAVGTLAVSVLWPSLAADALLVLLGLACGPVFAVLTRWRYWSETPFNMGFWSFSFPLAGLCSAVNETVLRGAWPIATALTATGVVSAVFAFLFYKSSVLTLRGQLLPMR